MNLPSKRWTSFDGWDYNGMRERLQAALDNIDKPALLRHTERIKGQKVIMSEPFSAGQYWICFEMIAEDGSLVIARVRLPRHPDVPATVREEDEAYGITCEIATMDTVNNLGDLYRHQGRLEEAEAMFQRALQGFQSALGLSHPKSELVSRNIHSLQHVTGMYIVPLNNYYCNKCG